MLRGEEHHDQSMAERARWSTGHNDPVEENINEGGGARPGSATLTEEEDATQHPKAIDMTGIEAEVRAKGLGRSVRSGGTGAY